MEWTYKGKEVTNLPPGKIGFVYVTHYSDGSFYIGKKLARSDRISPVSLHKKPRPYKIVKKLIVRSQMTGKILTKKKEIAAAKRRGVPAKMESYYIVPTEHKWREYEGSSDIKDGYTLVAKEITAWCNTERAMTFIETDLQFRTGSLFDVKCLNRNILGKFYPNVLDGEDIDGKDSLH